MKYQTPAAFRTALEDRLRSSVPTNDHESMAAKRKLIVFDRLLARLQTVAPDRWILKGAVALDFRLGDRARATKDLDLAWYHDEAVAAADLRAAQQTELGDYFQLQIERTGALDEFLNGLAVRYRVRAELAGRRFEIVTVDVGFTNQLDLMPDRLKGPDFLRFAGIEPTEVLALPLEQHIAEKLHAYTRVYSDGRQSTRVKDLVDLVLICSAAEFEARRLRQEISRTFSGRGVRDVPIEFPPPPGRWTTPYQKMAEDVGIDPEIAIGHALVARFLDPVLAGIIPPDSIWRFEMGNWEPPIEA